MTSGGGGGRPGEHGVPGRRCQERECSVGLTVWEQKCHHWVSLQGRFMDLTITSSFILQVPKGKKKKDPS